MPLSFIVNEDYPPIYRRHVEILDDSPARLMICTSTAARIPSGTLNAELLNRDPIKLKPV
jgi:hypothetical protein